MTMTVPPLPLPGSWLLAHALLFAAAAALVVGAALMGIVVGRVMAWGWKRGREYWRDPS